MHDSDQDQNDHTSKSASSTTWKKKVKTELCKYWLEGKVCENLSKEQGCGFAHGESEL